MPDAPSASVSDVQDAPDAQDVRLDDAARSALDELAVRGMQRGEVSPAQQQLVEAGLAMAKGPLLMPTPAGTAAAAARLRLPQGGEQEATLRRLLETFLPVNHRLRELCTSWQRRPDGTPNDHSDAAYDAGVRDELDDVDEAIGRVLRRMAAAVPSLERYRAELTAALQAFDDGDTTMLTSPLKPSYHTVWMWLHQELLLLIGMSRKEDEELEAALVAAPSA